MIPRKLRKYFNSLLKEMGYRWYYVFYADVKIRFGGKEYARKWWGWKQLQ